MGSEPTAATPGITTDLGAEETPAVPEGPAYAANFGPPEDGNYGDFTLPDGSAADPELGKDFGDFGKELGLSKAGAQKLVDFYGEKVVKKQLTDWSDHVQSLGTAAKADPEIGGAKYTESLGHAKAFMAKFGTPALRQVLNQYGVGAHVELIRAFAKAGKAMGETPALPPGGGAGAVQKPLEELFYGPKTSNT